MGEQLALDTVVPLPSANVRYLWRTAPESAFDAWLRTHKYVPTVLDPRHRPLPPRAFSEHTRRSYAALFGQYVRFLAKRKLHVVDARTQDVMAFLDQLPGRQKQKSDKDDAGGGAERQKEKKGKASAVTKRRALNVLDSAYNQLRQLELCREHPVKPLIGTSYTEKEESPASTVLRPSEHERLLAYIDEIPGDTFEDARRAALLAVAIGCGVCGDELRRLTVGQLALDEEPPLLIMPAWGLRTEVSLPLAEHTTRILRRWQNVRAQAGVDGELLFPARRDEDRPLGLQSLHRYAVAALQAIGRKERTGAQRVLRASFAARQLAHGDEQQVRRWLRLRTDKMIERYKRHAVDTGTRIR